MQTIPVAALTDDEVMSRVAADDSEALALLFDRHKSRLFAFLHHVVGDRALAEDLLGETFLRVYQARDRYRAGSGFLPWLFRIGRNLAIGELRRRGAAQRAHERLCRYPAVDEPADDLERKEAQEEVRKALRKLPEDQRSALVLKEYHDLGYREIAQALGCSEEAARARTYRARIALREALKAWWES